MADAEEDAHVDTGVERLLARVDDTLWRIAASGDGPAGALCSYVSGGKRLRARLAIAASTVGDSCDSEALVRYASFVEAIHAGGLCHDDVVDRSPRRRGEASLAASLGPRAASLAGLHLLLAAYELVADGDREVREAVGRAAERVASGQVDEMTELHRTDVSVTRYLERCRAKTGALFELAADLGARAGSASSSARRAVARFGAEVGLAFQLIDDVRDLRGEAVVGRPPGTDVREGVYTLPVLLTAQGLHGGGEEVRSALARVRMDAEATAAVERVRQIVSRNGSLAATLRHAHDAMARARECLGSLQGHRRGALRQLLEDLTLLDERSARRATAA